MKLIQIFTRTPSCYFAFKCCLLRTHSFWLSRPMWWHCQPAALLRMTLSANFAYSPIVTRPFLLPAATSTKRSTRIIWLSVFSLNLGLGPGLLIYGLVWDGLCARVRRRVSSASLCVASWLFGSITRRFFPVLCLWNGEAFVISVVGFSMVLSVTFSFLCLYYFPTNCVILSLFVIYCIANFLFN